jgi:hypothetical protein
VSDISAIKKQLNIVNAQIDELNLKMSSMQKRLCRCEHKYNLYNGYRFAEDLTDANAIILKQMIHKFKIELDKLKNDVDRINLSLYKKREERNELIRRLDILRRESDLQQQKMKLHMI